MADETAHITDGVRALLDEARRATLGTTAPEGRPRLVPVCFVVTGSNAYIPLDDKPKRVADPHRLARVRDLVERPAVTLLVDRWDEDWSRLAWARLDGRAMLLEPGDAAVAGERTSALAALRARYPQYRAHDLEVRPLIRIEVTRVVAWGDLSA